MIPARFVRAVNNTRPYGSHRYNMLGSKVGRRLTLFSRRAFDLWVRLELDPQVLAYCERPLQIPDVRPSRPVDLWVRTRDGERLCVVLRSAESTSAAQGHLLFQAFESWSTWSSMHLYLIHPHELDDPPTLHQNRVTMLHQLAGSHSLPIEPLMCGVTAACSHGATIGELDRHLASADSMLVRSAAFRLLLGGEARCPALAVEPLGSHTRLEPV
jgi:hypothetical protein